jgi:hypothetical protein
MHTSSSPHVHEIFTLGKENAELTCWDDYKILKWVYLCTERKRENIAHPSYLSLTEVIIQGRADVWDRFLSLY